MASVKQARPLEAALSFSGVQSGSRRLLVLPQAITLERYARRFAAGKQTYFLASWAETMERFLTLYTGNYYAECMSRPIDLGRRKCSETTGSGNILHTFVWLKFRSKGPLVEYGKCLPKFIRKCDTSADRLSPYGYTDRFREGMERK
jgi:hypothetical protein